jgi:hypothetical protein
MQRIAIIGSCLLMLGGFGCSKDKSNGASSGSTTGRTTAGTGTTATIGSTGSTGTHGSSGTSGTSGTNGSTGSTATTGATGSGSSSGSTGGCVGVQCADAGFAAYCAGTGAPIAVGDSQGDGGSTCLGNLAQRTFRFGLCTCDALDFGHPIYTDSFATVDAGPVPDGGTATAIVTGRNNGAIGSNTGVHEVGNGAHLYVGGSLFVADGGFDTVKSGSVSGELHAGSPVNSNDPIGADAFCSSDVAGNLSIAGTLHVSPGATVFSTVTATGGIDQTAAINVADPCDCNGLVAIANVVTSKATSNDNAYFYAASGDGGFQADGGLDPALFASGTGPADFTFPCGRYYLSGANLPGGTWHVAGHTAIFIAGDFTLGSFTLDVAPGAELDLFIAGNMSINGPSTLGTLESVTRTRFYVGGSQDITIAAPSGFYGNIYAPLARVLFNSPGDIYGAIFARAFINNSPAHLHYPEDILTAGAACVPPPVDAGFQAVDAGAYTDGGAIDGGVVAIDAGPPAPTGCNTCADCNNQACVHPTDAGPGACGACVTSADCCAPLTCQAGICGVVFR